MTNNEPVRRTVITNLPRNIIINEDNCNSNKNMQSNEVHNMMRK